jgi:hypothetical protein
MNIKTCKLAEHVFCVLQRNSPRVHISISEFAPPARIMTCRDLMYCAYFSHPEPEVAISSFFFAMRELTGNEQRDSGAVSVMSLL